MGSAWSWELAIDPVPWADLFALAARYGFSVRNSGGQINLFDHGSELSHPAAEAELIARLTAGTPHTQFWTRSVDGEEVDVYLAGGPEWSLDSAFLPRIGRADSPARVRAGRELFGRLSALWLEAAVTFGATRGRITDEWSHEQVWDLPGIHEPWAEGEWPNLLGWATYVAKPPAVPPLLSDFAVDLATGGTVVWLLDDPVTVDVLRYEDLHRRWLSAPATATPR